MYKNTVDNVRNLIKNTCPDAKITEDLNDDFYGYCLWMCNKIEKMKDLPRASRWIGWVLGYLEAKSLIKDNSISRDWIRQDIEDGNIMSLMDLLSLLELESDGVHPDYITETLEKDPYKAIKEGIDNNLIEYRKVKLNNGKMVDLLYLK